MVDLIRNNLLKFTNNFILKAKQIISASKRLFYSLIFFLRFLMFRYAFAAFDSNNDGSIDFDEFLLAVSATSQGDLDQRLEVAFNL